MCLNEMIMLFAGSKALVKGLAKELDVTESYLDKLAEDVRKGLSS